MEQFAAVVRIGDSEEHRTGSEAPPDRAPGQLAMRNLLSDLGLDHVDVTSSAIPLRTHAGLWARGSNVTSCRDQSR
jgi:hypothetical protein